MPSPDRIPQGPVLPADDAAQAAQVLWQAALSRSEDPGRARVGQTGHGWTPALLGGVRRRGRNLIRVPSGVSVQMDEGARDNLVVVGPIEVARLLITVQGSGNVVWIGGGRKFAGRITVAGRDNLFHAGVGATCNTGHFVMRSQRRSILIGEGSMLSFDIKVRCSDMHGIFDVETGEQLNPAESVCIGPHVWLGEEVIVLKGAEIGAGAIVGARALVSASVPPRSLSVGVPAKVLREGVSWTRQPEVGAQEREAVLQTLRGLEPAAGDLA